MLLVLLGLVFFWIVVRYAVRRDSRGLIAGVAAIWGILLAVLLLGVAPLIVQASYLKSVEIGNYLRQLPAGIQILSCCGHTSEDLVYYSCKKIEWHPLNKNNFGTLKRRLRSLPDRAILLADAHDLKLLQRTVGIKVLKQSSDILVLQKDNKALIKQR